MIRPFIFVLITFIASLSFGFSFSQDPGTLLGNWYLQERFLITDQNDDALLERAELETFAREFGYYLYGRNYQLTDLNQDGKLSFHEMAQRTSSEFSFRQQMDRKEIRELKTQYPELAQPTIEFLRANPSLVARLFSNLEWMYTHPKLATQLSQNDDWNTSHMETWVSLQKNLCWLATNPDLAKKLYKNREATQQVPELLGWRADHKSFMRSNPFMEGSYVPAFWPGRVRLGGN